MGRPSFNYPWWRSLVYGFCWVRLRTLDSPDWVCLFSGLVEDWMGLSVVNLAFNSVLSFWKYFGCILDLLHWNEILKAVHYLNHIPHYCDILAGFFNLLLLFVSGTQRFDDIKLATYRAAAKLYFVIKCTNREYLSWRAKPICPLPALFYTLIRYLKIHRIRHIVPREAMEFDRIWLNFDLVRFDHRSLFFILHPISRATLFWRKSLTLFLLL